MGLELGCNIDTVRKWLRKEGLIPAKHEVENKRCYACRTVKPCEEFDASISGVGGRKNRCKDCCREKRITYYSQNKLRELESNKQWVSLNAESRREWTSQYWLRRRLLTKDWLVSKMGGGCLECGYNKCAQALEFHHVEADDKDDCVSQMMRRCVVSKVVAEARKCVLLCCRCHRELHAGLVECPPLPKYCMEEEELKGIVDIRKPKPRLVAVPLGT